MYLYSTAKNPDPCSNCQGIVEMTRTFGLELAESLLSGYSPVFYKYQPFRCLLKGKTASPQLSQVTNYMVGAYFLYPELFVPDPAKIKKI